MKACVFVDGENFRHSIVNLFPHLHQEDYLPKLVKFKYGCFIFDLSL